MLCVDGFSCTVEILDLMEGIISHKRKSYFVSKNDLDLPFNIAHYNYEQISKIQVLFLTGNVRNVPCGFQIFPTTRNQKPYHVYDELQGAMVVSTFKER